MLIFFVSENIYNLDSCKKKYSVNFHVIFITQYLDSDIVEEAAVILNQNVTKCTKNKVSGYSLNKESKWCCCFWLGRVIKVDSYDVQ